MDRNYPGTGFGDLGAGPGWSYERSAKASLVYGSSRSSHPESELLHRQAYATPHPLQGYATNHHPGSSGQGGAWGAAGRSLGLSGLFDTGLHHASPSAPDASVMNLISALESRGPQPPPSASSLLSQFRTPSWQTAMHTPAPPELFISGALPGSGSFPSSSALSAYQHPASFSSRSFPTASLSLQDTPTFSPTSNGLLSPHDPLLHIKAPSQSSLGFDRLLSSQGAAAAAYRGSQDPTGATSAQASSARHLQSHQFNLLSSQLQDQSSQLYNASVFSSAQPQPQSQSQSNSAQERAVPRQDSVIKHYQRPTPAQSQLSSSAAHSLQHYLSCGGAGYQQIATHHRHAGLSCSPLGDQSPSSDHKPTSRTEQYRPIIQPPYSSSSSSSSSSSAGKGTKSSSSSGYSSASSASSSRTPHTPPSASSTSSSSSSSSATSGAHPSNSIPTSSSSAAPSRQQPPPQPAPPPPAPQQQQPPATSTSAPQSLPKSCLSGYGSPVPPVKTPTSALTGQTPPQQQAQSYSPNQPPTSHLAQSYGGFSSPQAQDLSSGTAGKGYGALGGRSQSYSTDIYGADSAYGSLPSSLGGAGSPSLGYGAPGHSPALLRSSGSSGSGASGGGSSSGTGSGNSGSGGGAGNSMTNERGGGGSGGGSYHIPDSSPSPSGNSGIIRPGLHSPVPTCPTQSPGGAGSNKYISSVLSPTFLASPQGYPDTRGPSSQPQSYHSTSSKTKADTSMLGVGSQRTQEEVDDDDEFLIQHLLQAQASPAPQAAHHHPQQPPQQASQQTQPQPQSVPPTTDSGKGLSYDMGKTSEERYHPQSVIRTHSATSTAGVGNAGTGGSISGLDTQLEMSLKKQQQQHQQHHHPQQQQQQRNERSVGSSRSSGGRGSAEQVHSHLHHHDNLGSVVHYGRGDPYSQHSLAPQHSSHSQHVSSHSQIPSHTQMELQKKPQERAEIPYPRKTPEVQQQHSQSQAAASLMDSPTDQSRQPPHLLQSVLSHTTRNKLEPHQQHHKMDSHRQHQQHPKMDSHPQHQQHQKMDSHQHQQHHKIDSHSQHQQHHKMDSHAQQQQHSISQQQAVMESAGGRLGSSKHQAQAQSQTTQLQLQLQSQALEVAAAHYNHGPPPHQHEQSQVKQSSVVSSLDMLERSLSQTSSTDVAVAEDRRGGAGSGGRSGGSSERHRQQQQQQQQQQQEQHPSHHQPQQSHHSQQHSASELHSFLSEPDISLSTPSHMHHLSQHHPQQQQQQQHPSSQHQQTHSHHPHTQPHPQQQPPLPHHIPPPSASAHSQPQPDSQQPLSSQLTPQQSQLDQQRSEQHQFDTVSPVEKADQSQQSNRFVPLTSICFPDSLLQDEDRSFFPGMEDMFCAEDYKSSCAGGAGPGQGEMNESHTGQEGMDSMKAGQSAGGGGGSAGASYDIMGHHGGDQGYEPYCHGLEEPSNNTMTLDLDSLKTHELPSTVNTEQLGLIQSQAPAMGMGSNTAGPNNSGAKMSSGPGGASAGTGSGGLQSPIFCSSRPKKLLKSSSFHLLKERRDPNTLPKKSYAQEYEFEDDEDKADQPADIRLNSRRLPDLLPDLVSSCRKGGGSGSLSPLMGDIDFYHSSGYSSMGSHTLLPQDGPKKRGRKPTRPKREGPPRPRGRPRIRPMPEPYTPRGMMGEMGGTTVGGGFSVEGRGRGRGRGSRGRGGRREDMYMEMSGKDQDQMHHHHLHQQQQQQLHHQPQPQQHEPIPPLKIKLPIGTLSSSDALLRTDSLSGTDPALSDGSVGSAPSLGLSPGPPCSTESSRSQDKNKQKSQMMGEGVDDEGLEERGDEKDSESKAGFVASFLDFLKTGKRPPGLDISPGMEPDNGETSPCKSGGLRPLSPAPPPPPPPPPFGDGEGNGGLALGNCPSPKRLEDELKRNLETLPSFSSDEEDSVGKNQDLQKSISSAISALYDTPQLTSNIQPPLPPPPPQPQPQPQPTQGPLTPTLQPPTLSPQPTMHTPHTQPQSNEPDVLQPEDGDMDENKEEENEEERSTGGEGESDMTEEREPQLETLGAPKLDAALPEIPPAPTTPEPPSVPPSPATSSSPSHSPLPPLSLPSPLPPPEEQQENSQPPSPVAPTSPSPPPPPPPTTLPQPATPPPASPPPPPSTQKESPMPSPESPASPEEPPAPKITSLHLAQKQEDAAIVGESEEDESESGGEGIFRERDEFVVRVEDIRTLKLALQTGREPPPIWRVQKALLQKFSPEIKDGQRQFCATSNYLGYFGDAKRRYQRIYVKFLENVNKKDYVRVCSRRPWRRATPALRRQSLPRMASPPTTQVPPRVVEKEERVAPPVQREQREKTRTATTTTAKEQREKKDAPAAMPKAREREKEREHEKEKEKEREKEKRVQPQQEKLEKRAAAAERGRAKEEKKAVERKEKEKAERPPKSKLTKVKAEPPPKKRKKWLKEVPSSSDSDSSDEAASENEMPVKGGVNNRAMREMFRSYVEMLVSTALDPDMIQALEDTDDELYLPPMRKIDSILSEQKRRLLRRVSMSSQHQEVLHAYPQIIVDPLDTGVVRVRLSGDAYNRKTLNRVKKTLPKPQDLKLSAETYRIYSLYHSLHHYKYHTFLQCKKETNTIEQAAEDPGQEEVVQQCMANQSWLDTLFSSFIELLTLSTKA
ncbi:proline-rich protein 12 [Trachinotus anak]|uniref:proline-rich protein 12 n=1 Tax=Trachinotus anak TaxID=443729 RepID=UPI0039F1EBA1